MTSRTTNSRRQTRRARPAVTRRLLENLESRLLLTTYVVNSLGDSFVTDGLLTLREAIVAADTDSVQRDAPAGSGVDTITFDPALFNSGARTLTLTAGALSMNTAMVITGPGSGLLTIDGNDASGIFLAWGNVGGTAVRIEGLTLTGGARSTSNGGALSAATGVRVELQDIHMVGNRAANGGALHVSNATVDATDVLMEQNTATSSGGAALVSNGTLILRSSTATQNASGNAGGGIALTGTANVSLIDSYILNNQATTLGGGIYAPLGTLSLLRSVVSGNTANNNGGGIHGAIAAPGSVISIAESEIASNAGYEGAGFAADAGTVTITNSTIHLNQATYRGAVRLVGSTASLVNVTITGNVAPNAAGIYGSSKVTVRNTLVAGNNPTTPNDVLGTFAADSGYNLIGVIDGSSNLAANSLYGTAGAPLDAQLGPFADHGGPLFTYALQPGSPALDAGSQDYALAAGLVTDQRGSGFPRQAGLGVDIGAFEARLGTATITGLVYNDRNADGTQHGTEPGIDGVIMKAYLDDGDGVAEIGGDDVLTGQYTTTGGGTFSLGGLPAGTYYVRVDETSSALIGFRVSAGSNTQTIVVAPDTTVTGATFAYFKPLIVSTLADEDDGNHTAGDLSLREAVGLAGAAPGHDVILFDPALNGGTIALAAGRGQLSLTHELTLRGPGADQLTINAGGNNRVLYIGGSAGVAVTGLTLRGGYSPVGGGVYVDSSAALTMRDVTVADSTAAQRGGGVYIAFDGSLDLQDVTVNGNVANHQGGGIFVDFAASATVRSTTFVGNTAVNAGGAIFADGEATLLNTTISGNRSNRHGGGIYADLGVLTIVNSTIAYNIADADADAVGTGGGLYINTAATLHNTIIAANLALSTPDDIAGLLDVASSHNLLGVAAGGIAVGVNGNRAGTTGAPLDPLLMPLQVYAGARAIHMLRPESPAVESGDSNIAIAHALSTDAAGMTRTLDHDGDSTAVVDMGAAEALPVLVVDSLQDEAADTDGLLSLREALLSANAQPGFNPIRFAPALRTGDALTVPITDGPLSVASNVEILGFTDGRLTIERKSADPLLDVASGVLAILGNLTLASTAGSPDATGVLNSGMLQLHAVTLAGHTSAGNGGAIHNTGSLLLRNVTISGNTASHGGGIYQSAGTLDALNVTVSSNTATTSGGGIHIAGGSAKLVNTIVAGNRRTPADTPDDVWGAFAGGSFNFIGAVDGSTGLGGAGTQYGTAAAPADPRLAPLADNGGPVFTHGVLPASPVVDAGSDADALAAGLVFDARGFDRYRDGNDDVLVRIDKGAFEQQFPLNQAPVLSAILTVPGAVEGVTFRLRYEGLLAATIANDPEGQPLSFVIDGILAGTATTAGGQPIVPGVTTLGPGEELLWTPPPITFGNEQTATLDALQVRVYDGQVASLAALPVPVQVTTTAAPVNYAVLFSGGDRAELNYGIYYSNLRRLYDVLTTTYGVRPSDIFIVYADGRDPAPDQRGSLNSDMSFAPNVLSATRDNLRNTLINLSTKVDANDHLFVWTFDHGLGTPAKPAITGEEVIKGWGADQAVTDEEFAVWLQGLQAGQDAATFAVPENYAGIQAAYTTYAFAQCYAGGMLDNLTPSAQVFGAASSNHYEASYADYFAAAFTDALAAGFNNTHQAFAYAFNKDGRARAATPNAGQWAFNVEHPWSSGGSFPIFATARDLNAAPEITAVTPLKVATGSQDLVITYDMLTAAVEAVDATGQALSFRFTAVNLGTLLDNGTPVDLSDLHQATLSYGETLTFRRPIGSTGVLNALQIVAVAADGTISNAVTLPVRVGNPATGAVANPDAYTLQSSNIGALLNVLANDAGPALKIIRVGQPSHGILSLDPATSQLRYTPAAEFLGSDLFTYVVQDADGNTDLAAVAVILVSYDPAQAPQQTRYSALELAPPPGWAGLPTTWDWTYRQSIPNWTSTAAVDINDEGVVLVSTARPNDAAIHYVGSTNASYWWVSGDVEPYWNASQTGDQVASNALILLLGAVDPETGLPLLHGGREVFDGILASSVQTLAVTPHTRYLNPDNSNEAGLPSIGGIWYDVGTEDNLWQEVPLDLYPVGSIGGVINNPTWYVAANNTGTLSGLPRQAELWRVWIGGSELVAAIPGSGGAQRSEARAISDNGMIVGWAEYATDAFHAFLYDIAAETATNLGALPGYAESDALAVNGVGHVVGFSADNIGDRQAGIATLWRSGQALSLGTLGGSGWSIAYDINDEGLIVGASNNKAVIWINDTPIDLNTLVDALPAGAVLTEARGINRAGQIAATGTVGGLTRAFFLDLASALSAANDSYTTSRTKPITFNPLNNDEGGQTISSVDLSSIEGLLTWSPDGAMTFDPTGAFDDLLPGQSRDVTFTYTVRDTLGGVDTATVTITVEAVSTFHVAAWTTHASGVDLTLSHTPDLALLNLLGTADLTLVGDTGGAVAGSMTWNASASTLHFVATGGVLPNDTYTLTLRSAADGFTSSVGDLDGDADDAAGGNFIAQFTVSAAAPVLSAPDVARGPGQALTGGQLGSGLPLTISNASGLRSLDFTLAYDPALLTVSGISLEPGMPADWQVSMDVTQPGEAHVSIWGVTALPTGTRTLARIAASVPSTAAIGSNHLLHLTHLNANELALTLRADTAVHHVGYPGDATGDGFYTGMDAALAARLALGLDPALAAFPWTDPVLIADVTGNGAVTTLDAGDIAQAAAQIAVPHLPALPGVITPPAPSGPARTVALPPDVTVPPAGSTQVPLTIDNVAGLQALDLTFTYDAALVTLAAQDFALGAALPGWSLLAHVLPGQNRVHVVVYAPQPLVSGTGTALSLTLHSAGAGVMPLTLGGQLNEGAFTPTFVPSTVQVGDVAGAIAGTLYHDLLSDGSLNGDDTPLANWTIFLDTNDNATLDPGETQTATAADGTYHFTNLPVGAYTIRALGQSGYVFTAPSTPRHALTLAAGEDLAGVNFAVFATAIMGTPGSDDLTLRLSPDTTRLQVFTAANPLTPAREAPWALLSTLELSQGTFTIADDLAPISLVVGAGAAVHLQTSQHLASLTLNGGVITLQAAGGVIVADAFTYTAGGIDLITGNMILRNVAFEEVYTLVKSGFAGNTWTGPGIRSSAATADPSHRTLMTAPADKLRGGAAFTFAGHTVSGADVVIGFTYVADANLDGRVDTGDLGALASNWRLGTSGGTPPADGARPWQADFNYDGRVDTGDLGALASNWRAGTTTIQAVPEPAAASAEPEPAETTPVIEAVAESPITEAAQSAPVPAPAAIGTTTPVTPASSAEEPAGPATITTSATVALPTITTPSAPQAQTPPASVDRAAGQTVAAPPEPLPSLTPASPPAPAQLLVAEPWHRRVAVHLVRVGAIATRAAMRWAGAGDSR